MSWTLNAQKQFREVYDYISQDSELNATKVAEDILLILQLTAVNPEMHPIDRFKIFNDGSYRAFEKHHYRITYRYSNNKIKVLTIRHTSRNPKWT